MSDFFGIKIVENPAVTGDTWFMTSELPGGSLAVAWPGGSRVITLAERKEFAARVRDALKLHQTQLTKSQPL